MKFLKEVTRKSDGVIFKIGDKVVGIGTGEYYIGTIYEHERYKSGIGVAGYKNKEDVYKYLEHLANSECGFNDLNSIEHI